jgi:ribosomal protein S18 acetylase RimI-like enzyme
MAEKPAGEMQMADGALTCTALDPTAAAAALPVWREAAQWLVDRGEPLWPPAIFDDAFVTEACARGLVIGAALDGRVVGVALLQWRDDRWWPDRASDAAAYIHKIAVARASAGRGIVDALVAECERRARARGIGIIRLDTARLRPKLRVLYERLGFMRIDFRTVDSFDGVRYEKAL